MNKKYAILFVIVACLLALAGCNGESEVIADSGGPPELLEDDDKGDTNMPFEEEEKVNISMMGDEIVMTDFYYQHTAEMLEGAYKTGVDPEGFLIVSYLHYGFIYGEDVSNDVSIPLSIEKYLELVKIIEDNDLASWDGFGKDDDPSIMLVGNGSFLLEIKWNDGSSVSAGSQQKRPGNFEEADQAIHTFFESFRKEWKRINGV